MAAKVLIGSTIRQKPAILREFLKSLTELDRTNLTVDYMFVDDNELLESGDILRSFKANSSNVYLVGGDKSGKYNCNEVHHEWNESLVWKVAAFKDRIIDYAKQKNYDYLFLVDSDLVLHPKTLIHLVSTDKDIISEIFWTKWNPDLPELPQVWVSDQYNLFYHNRGKKLLKQEIESRTRGFLYCLKIPGIYEVGGLGACTLISKKALQSGVCYKEIKNLTFWGEDRHFCIRAAALGFKLYVDTFFPALHIYRESELEKVAAYKKSCKQINVSTDTVIRTKTKSQNNKLTLSMLVRNEADRYLAAVLQHARQYIDNAVILDDASEDNTVEMCKEILKGIPLTIKSNKNPGFGNEVLLRKQQWELTISTNPDWILCLDADEMFEDKVKDEIRSLINQPYYDYFSFRLYDFWNDTHYREDTYWQAHKFFRIFLIRYQPTYKYIWHEAPIHCGRLPANIAQLPGAVSHLRIKHFGWADLEDRKRKYKRYMQSDPDGKYGNIKQYRSILDADPHLVKWQE